MYGGPNNCTGYSTSPDKIDTGDAHADNVHNFAVDVYEWHRAQFGYSSMDGRDMAIVSLAHYGKKYNNAFFNYDGYLAYGDGDGDSYRHFGQMDIS